LTTRTATTDERLKTLDFHAKTIAVHEDQLKILSKDFSIFQNELNNEKNELKELNSLFADKFKQNIAEFQSFKNLFDDFKKNHEKIESMSIQDLDNEWKKKEKMIFDEMNLNLRMNEDRIKEEMKKFHEEWDRTHPKVDVMKFDKDIKEIKEKVEKKNDIVNNNNQQPSKNNNNVWYFKVPHKKKCYHCGLEGHERKQCKEKICYCKIHGEGKHSTNECYTIWKLIEDNRPIQQRSSRPTQKPWRRKNDET